jgi:hypothetical protein
MLDLVIGITALVALIAGKRIWSPWFKSTADDAQLWAEEKRNEQQESIKSVYDERKTIIDKNERWFKIEDIENLAK